MKPIAKAILLTAFLVFTANTSATANLAANIPASAQCQSPGASLQVADTCTSFCTLRVAGRCVRRETRCTGDNGVRG